MMSFEVVLLVVTNLMWLGIVLYVNFSWKDAYEDVCEDFTDILKDILGEESEEFQEKGDEMR